MLLHLFRKVGLFPKTSTQTVSRSRWHRYGAILRLEELENRLVPSTYTVNTVADTPDANPGSGTGQDANGKVSLRSAITEGNAREDPNVTINFQQGLTGPITLGSALDDLNKNFTIIGPGSANFTIQRDPTANTNFRIFTTSGVCTDSISGLTLTNGNAGTGDGGAIKNMGNLTLVDVDCHNNIADNGGAIYNSLSGSLTASAVFIYLNTAATNGGGLDNAHGTIQILSSSHIFSNNAEKGGGIYNGSGNTLTVRDSSQIYGNGASKEGGGVFNRGTFTMTGGLIEVNTAGINGGGVANEAPGQGTATANLTQVSLQRNQAAKNGGGFYLTDGSIKLDTCRIQDNRATNGIGPGGAWATGTTQTTPNCTGTDVITELRQMGLLDQSDYNATATGNRLLSQVVTDNAALTNYVFTPVTVDANGFTMSQVSTWIVTPGGSPTFTQAELVVYSAVQNGDGTYGGPDTSAPVFDATADVSLTDRGSGYQGETYQVSMSNLAINLSQGHYYVALAPVQDTSCMCYVLTTLSSYSQNTWYYNPNGGWGHGITPQHDSYWTGQSQDYAYQILGW